MQHFLHRIGYFHMGKVVFQFFHTFFSYKQYHPLPSYRTVKKEMTKELHKPEYLMQYNFLI